MKSEAGDTPKAPTTFASGQKASATFASGQNVPTYITSGIFSGQATPPPSVKSRFLVTARTDEEIHAASRRIPQENRPTDPVALAKLRARATIGIDPQFTFLDLDNTDLTLQHTYNVSMRIQSFEYILTQYDMIDAFKIHLFKPDVDPPTPLDDGQGNPIFINLLTHHSSLTENQVRQYILFLKRYGQGYDVQNLDWTQELFNNSCSADLRDKVNEKVLGVHPFEIAGPLLFFHAMSLITTQTADAVRALTLRVTNLKLGDIQGENVGTAISQMRGALLRLKALDKVPNDIVDKILDTMQTSSVEKFNRFFENISFQLRLTPNAYNAEDILHLAEKTHREFVASGEWTGIHNTGTTFTAGIQPVPQTGDGTQSRRRWRRQGPKDGEKEVMQRGGKTYYWCGRCRLWNTTHRTSEHIKGGPKSGEQPSVQNPTSVQNTAHLTQTGPSPAVDIPPTNEDPQVFYSPLPVSSFPSETHNAYQSGTSMAFLTRQNRELQQCKQDIDQIRDLLALRSSDITSPPHSE